ncbi:hypothetical protein Ngar_c03530 [Candidatus Nitrososphaera gargensis Ga9.2]|uniref:Uncharacterized protein n=1 Tax=Nitrososphaera gargensis (strain Ga9.2) TaxID=1237085 RepID=K0IHI7_NITGG|nr:hypothetical protein [Candidatus Nitrososphaera gargensis]AFU57272.1 hypothetical protein Ngar_c03240 [Candidatus Nitrososphaera gargensis Ga9.2]AFU57301.1 hypothetical protein Ngar_c03530 [Candidatus Nitrososphaera gargensis Ga9.2]
MQYLIFTATFPLEGKKISGDHVKQLAEIFRQQFASMGAEVEITVQSDPVEQPPTTELG